MEPLNPYTVGNPISQELGFFGRATVVREVMSMLAHPHANAIVLHGQRRIGKTSILLQLHRILKEEGRFTPIYLDLQDKASLPLDELLYRLAQEIAEAIHVEPPERSLFDSEGNYFRKGFLPALSTLSPLALLFDEFDVLDGIGRSASQSFFPYLRKWMSSIQSVNFVFVLGRRPEDLSTETLSTFKSVIASRVASLEKSDAESVVRQSETKNGLQWQASAVEKVWDLAQGHPYFTQLLASVVWDTWRGNGAPPVPVAPDRVEAAIPQALRLGAHSFLWIWDGLPPAERVVLAALAEAHGKAASQDDLADILNKSGVRLIVRELLVAPDNLIDWGVLKNVEGSFGFSVPLFRQWVSVSFPLRRVKDELDRLNPLADNLFAAAKHFYQLELLPEAKGQLVEALRFNPNHLSARTLLGNILLEEGDISGAVATLEEAYRADYTVRPDYVRALLASAEIAEEEEQVEIYRKILSIDPRQPLAAERLSRIQDKRKKQQIIKLLELATQAEKAGDWEAAISVYQQVRGLAPDRAGIEEKITEAERQVWLLAAYREAISALTKGAKDEARKRLVEIIAVQPDYQEAARYLLLAVQGIDVKQVEEELSLSEAKRRAADEKAHRLEKAIQEYREGKDPDFLAEFQRVFGSASPDARVVCQVCGTQVKGKNLLRHFALRHLRTDRK